MKYLTPKRQPVPAFWGLAKGTALLPYHLDSPLSVDDDFLFSVAEVPAMEPSQSVRPNF